MHREEYSSKVARLRWQIFSYLGSQGFAAECEEVRVSRTISILARRIIGKKPVARFRIPADSLPGFEVLATLSEPIFQEVLNGVKNIPVGALPLSYKNTFKVPSLAEPQLGSVARMVFTLGSIVSDYEDNFPSVAADLIVSYSTQIRPKEVQAETLSTLKDRIIKVFENCGSLGVTYKAATLSESAPMMMRTGKIITDVRPVFQDGEINSQFGHSVITHQLCIDYSDHNVEKRLYVMMDSIDLDTLKTIVERAIKKEEQIRNEPAIKAIKFIRE